MNPRLATYRYGVDADDRLSWVDSMWRAFAQENGAVELNETAVIGRTLWDFMADAATRQLYSQIHEAVRTSGETCVVPIRCDSPSLERHMRLTIIPGEAGQLTYESVLTRAEPQERLILLDNRQTRSGSVLTMCSCCKRCLVEPHGWLDMDEVTRRLGLSDQQNIPVLRYDVCPDCQRMRQPQCAQPA